MLESQVNKGLQGFIRTNRKIVDVSLQKQLYNMQNFLGEAKMKNRVLTAFRLPTAQNNAVTELAKQQGTTRTQAVETLINAGLQALKSPDKAGLK